MIYNKEEYYYNYGYIFYGLGNNGKTTLLNILKVLFSKYIINLSLRQLILLNKSDLLTLINDKNIILVEEINTINHLNIDNIIRDIGYKYKKKIIFCTNEKILKSRFDIYFHFQINFINPNNEENDKKTLENNERYEDENIEKDMTSSNMLNALLWVLINEF